MTPAREQLIEALREHALVIGEVVLDAAGTTSQYYLDVKRAILRPDVFATLGELIAEQASQIGATAIGGPALGAGPVACAALAAGADCKGFIVRPAPKPYGLRRRIEGPGLDTGDRCLLVDDVVASGATMAAAIAALASAGTSICGVVSVVDRLAGGAGVITALVDAPYVTLATIDDVYPERPDRPA
jgi:orotate phosphoribosyltransferase